MVERTVGEIAAVVWEAVTDPGRLAAWFPTPVQFAALAPDRLAEAATGSADSPPRRPFPSRLKGVPSPVRHSYTP